MKDEHWEWYDKLSVDEQIRHLQGDHKVTLSEDDPTTAEEAHDSAHWEGEAE